MAHDADVDWLCIGCSSAREGLTGIMRILYVTQGFPYPLTSGFLRHYHFIRELSARHTIDLLAVVGADYQPAYATAMAPYTARVQTFQAAHRSRTAWRKARLRAQALLMPQRGDAAVRQLRDAVRDLARNTRYDAVVLTGKRTFPVLDVLPGVPVVADLCDATSMRVLGHLEHARGWRRIALAMELVEVRRVERWLVQRAAHLVFAAARDRDALVPATGHMRCSVIPNGVDVDYWRRTSARLGERQIVFTGAMQYAPNEDAALYLADAIMPLVRRTIPDAELWIVGRDPKPRLSAAGAQPGVEVTGFVDDVRPFLERAAVFAAPLRFGAGIQNKLLEAMAMAVPVVASPLAADGLRTGDGGTPPLQTAGDAAAFAAALAARLTAARRDPTPDLAARQYVEAHFRWETNAAALEQVLHRVADAARRRT
jgi:polysaccharide biosynthesis protein PslH